MVTSISGAVTAYQQAKDSIKGSGTEPRTDATGNSFADLLGDIAGAAKSAGVASERATMGAIAGKTDISEVVMAVSQAEVTLQTVVSIRDRVVSAYQEILRMPI